jgi:PGF-CTERM protein
VNVESVTVSEGGFVTIHDSTVLDGALFDSVRGTSDYIEAGTAENVTVELDRPVGTNESGDTFIAMPHLDTDGDETYDFVTSEGAEDAPYTDSEGNAVVDTATITVNPAATATFEDQETEGDSVVVASTSLPNGGFVTIHDSTVADDPFGSVRGTSDYLEPGESTDVEVSLDTPVEESGQFFAMPHRDSDGDETYDFVSSDGADDAPYLNANGEIVLDGAQLTLPSTPTPTETATPTDAPDTATPTDEPSEPTDTETTSGGQPGFGLALSLIALIGAALIALRRRD